VLKKKKRAVVDTGQPCTKATIETLVFMLCAYRLFVGLPFHAERRIGKHVVKLLTMKAVL